MNIFYSKRLKEHKEGLDIINDLAKNKSRCLIIHYSCESFVTSHGRTPRITSICVRNLETAQVISFSIHLQAQFMGLDFLNLTDQNYDNLEKSMLNDFSKFVKQHSSFRWIHWNMRDSNYGFTAINNRIRILKGVQFEIDDDMKFDFPRILALIYTQGYEKNNPDGRLLNLAVRNGMSTVNALKGSEEANAFDSKEYLKLHMSTLKKVDLIESIFQRVVSEELIVLAKKKHVYGLTIMGMIEIVQKTWWLLLLVSVLGYLLGSAFEPVVQYLFGTSNIGI